MNLQGTLYSTANDSVHGQELWKSDGTAAGTVMLSDMSCFSSNAPPQELTAVGELLFFMALDAEGWELWKSDGTAAGTLRVKDLYPGSSYDPDFGILPNSSFPSGLVNRQGTLYFSARTAEPGQEL